MIASEMSVLVMDKSLPLDCVANRLVDIDNEEYWESLEAPLAILFIFAIIGLHSVSPNEALVNTEVWRLGVEK